MNKIKAALPLALAVLTACASPQPEQASMGGAPPREAAARLPPYLADGEVNVLTVLLVAPKVGDSRYENDRAIFRATRRWQGTPRWQMAADDAALSTDENLKHFACALDMELTTASAPKTVRLLQRAGRDAAQAMNVAKEHFQRKRPFWIDDGETCRPKAELGESYDYPSGHTMIGWTWGLILSQVVPERGDELLARGRAVGESRIVCGVHNATAVEAGRMAATAVFTRFLTKPEFTSDVDAARAELAALKGSTRRPDARACAVERELVAQPIY